MSLLGNLFRRIHFFLNLALSAALLASLLFICAKLDFFISFPRKTESLSPRAKSMLSELDGKIKAIAVIPHDNVFYDSIRQLLIGMKAASGADIGLEFLDPHADVARAADAVRRYGAEGWSVIFEKGDRFEIVPFASMIEKTNADGDSILPGSAVHTRFRAEQLCVTALARLARPVSPVIYSLSGHGERDFGNYNGITGYSDLAREIRREGYELRPLNLANSGLIPEDCDLLVVAGPRLRPLPNETEAIVSYLSKGGRLLFMMDRPGSFPSGWEELASRIGISFPGLTAISYGSLGGYNLSLDNFSSHAIVRNLSKSAVTFSGPQVLDPDSAMMKKYRLKADVLVNAHPFAWGEKSPEVLPRRYDPGIDRKGDLPLALAIEVEGARDIGVAMMKAFAIGDSNLGSNAFLGGGNTGNRDIILNAIDWLTENGMPSAPSIAAEGSALQLNLSRKRQIRLWVNSVFAWPASVALFGLAIRTVRKFIA